MKHLKHISTITLLLLLVTACHKTSPPKSLHESLLSIQHYACNLNITFYSNKNTTTYTAIQEYNTDGNYYMEFLDPDQLKIQYENNTLQLSSNLFSTQYTTPYEERNQNPLFLSYFLNRYFASEDSSIISKTENSITLKLPEYNTYIDYATLTLENNLPKSLTYFDKNGTPKVNIIYSEFVSNSSC